MSTKWILVIVALALVVAAVVAIDRYQRRQECQSECAFAANSLFPDHPDTHDAQIACNVCKADGLVK